jgi:hypothetical protein
MSNVCISPHRICGIFSYCGNLIAPLPLPSRVPEKQMTQSTDHPENTAPALSLEGRLLAHRLVLSALLRLLPEARRGELLVWLEERALYQDGQEDPGAVPGTGLELELARADEFRMLKQLLESSGR